MRIVLASSSPSRAAILKNAGIDPIIAPSHVDEEALTASLPPGVSPARTVETLATAKARRVAETHRHDVVIGCDSMLLIDRSLTGKPLTVDATIERWRAQAGTTAELYTGHCVIIPGSHDHVESSVTAITFASPTDADIVAYAATGEPLHCAGAFTLEAIGGWFIDRIEGDPSGVVGISLPVVRRALYAAKLNVSDFFQPGTVKPGLRPE